MSNELKPCPFCGGKAELRCFMNFYWVKCIKCEVSTDAKPSLEKTIKAWNRRTNNERNA